MKRQLSKNIRVIVESKGQEIELQFQIKRFVFFGLITEWVLIWPHRYFIEISGFADIGMHKKGDPFFGKPRLYTIQKGLGQCWQGETWRPGQFNLETRITEIFQCITKGLEQFENNKLEVLQHMSKI